MVSLRKLALQASAAGTVALAMVGTTLAAGATDPGLSITGAPISTGTTLKTVLSNVGNSIVNLVVYIAGFVAILYLIWSGFKYLTAGGDTKKAGEARQGIINAVIGIIIILAAYTILNFAAAAGRSAGNSATATQTF